MRGTVEKQDLQNVRDDEEMNPSETSDMYLRLGIKKDASYEEIKEAYRKAALHWHPDRNTDKEKSHLEFIAVSEAFEVLSKRVRKDESPKKSDEENKTYEYYDKLFREIFKDDSIYYNASPQLKMIIDLVKEFKL